MQPLTVVPDAKPLKRLEEYMPFEIHPVETGCE